MSLRLYFGNDHAGFEHREALLAHLRQRGVEVIDHGFASLERSDYPDAAHPVARAVAAEPGSRGILICGSGVGMSIAANRHKGIRAPLVVDAWTAEMSRRHNDANILCLRSREQTVENNIKFIDLFLDTPFEGGRHCGRLEKVDQPEPAKA